MVRVLGKITVENGDEVVDALLLGAPGEVICPKNNIRIRLMLVNDLLQQVQPNGIIIAGIPPYEPPIVTANRTNNGFRPVDEPTTLG